MNPFLAVTLFLLMVAAVFLLVSLAVWWLVPLAFPALSFGFGNAMALTALSIILIGPAAVTS